MKANPFQIYNFKKIINSKLHFKDKYFWKIKIKNKNLLSSLEQLDNKLDTKNIKFLTLLNICAQSRNN